MKINETDIVSRYDEWFIDNILRRHCRTEHEHKVVLKKIKSFSNEVSCPSCVMGYSLDEFSLVDEDVINIIFGTSVNCITKKEYRELAELAKECCDFDFDVESQYGRCVYCWSIRYYAGLALFERGDVFWRV